MKPKPGDYVEVKTKEEVIKGILMPQEGKTTVIKLDNGYNMGVDNKNIKGIKVVKKKKKSRQKIAKVKQKKGLPNIVVLHTGGTIASKVDYETGAVISRFSPEELLAMFPELRKFANIGSRLIGNMWSQDMRFSHYNFIAKEIAKEIKKGVDGIIVTQGTDTLHYTPTAIAFILENLPIPVIFVGSQRSSDRGSSDAGLNLINAVYFAANSDFKGVAICMHHSSSDDYCAILSATKSRKMHTSRRDAFKSINTKPLALVDYKTNIIKSKTYSNTPDAKLKIKLINEKVKVGILKQYTNMNAEEFLFFKNYDGLVIEATGLGNLPITELDNLTKEHTRIFKALKKMIKDGLIVVLSPQTIFGRINMNVYENGRRQMEIGILGNYSDMTTETTFIKLAWLLSNYKKEEVKELITENLRGEISTRTEEDAFLP